MEEWEMESGLTSLPTKGWIVPITPTGSVPTAQGRGDKDLVASLRHSPEAMENRNCTTYGGKRLGTGVSTWDPGRSQAQGVHWVPGKVKARSA